MISLKYEAIYSQTYQKVSTGKLREDIEQPMETEGDEMYASNVSINIQQNLL